MFYPEYIEEFFKLYEVDVEVEELDVALPLINTETQTY